MNKLSVSMVGDLILEAPGPMEYYFSSIGETLKAQDISLGHLETPHCTPERAQSCCIDIPAPPSPPEHLNSLVGLFHAVSTAGNHAFDCGPNGVIDTCANLDALGIPHCGTGANIEAAKAPVFLEKNGMKIGLLSYNLAGPSLGWATSQKAGCNYVRVNTAYTPARDMPGCPPKIHTWINAEDIEKYRAEIRQLKSSCDVAIILVHQGNGGDGPALSEYETFFARDCIDCGADAVFAHHHHILKGMEIYKGKPVYYGLGNFVCATYAMTLGYNKTPEMLAYLKQREREGRGGGKYPVDFYPWSEDSRMTGIAKVVFSPDADPEAYFIPCFIEPDGRITLRTRENGDKIFDYVCRRVSGAGLNARLSWSEDGESIRIK